MTALAELELHRPAAGTPAWTAEGPCAYDERGMPVSGVERDPAGATRWYRNYRLHRDGDLPAVIWDRGEQSWYRDGDLHRDGDKPARTYPDGRREHHCGGALHRDGAPAVYDPGTGWFPLDECAEITPGVAYERWCQKDFNRRAFGPLKHANGEHRLDGPSSYALDGSWERWHQRGRLHRSDGPALRTPDGTLSWYLEGRLHRADGPAVTHPDGKVEYYQRGLRHRSDGPAVVFANGRKQYWVDGVKVPAPGRGELPQGAPSADFEIVTYSRRRFRLGRRLTERPLRQNKALEFASEWAELTGGGCVLRSKFGYLRDGQRLEKAYDTVTGGGNIVYGDDHLFWVYEAELLDAEHSYPQPSQRPADLPPIPDEPIAITLRPRARQRGA